MDRCGKPIYRRLHARSTGCGIRCYFDVDEAIRWHCKYRRFAVVDTKDSFIGAIKGFLDQRVASC